MKNQFSSSCFALVARPVLAVVVAAAALVACGGGGGGDGRSTPPPQVPPAQGPFPSSIVTTAQSNTYPAGSAEKAAFEYLNAERLRDGFGAVAQSAPLDAVARGHADYNLLNFAFGHYQRAGDPGFTGIEPHDRVLALGLRAEWFCCHDRRHRGKLL